MRIRVDGIASRYVENIKIFLIIAGGHMAVLVCMRQCLKGSKNGRESRK